MNKILFFDDTVVNRRRNVIRRFHQPQWLPECAFSDEDPVSGTNYFSVSPQPEHGYFLHYLACFPGESLILDFLGAVCLAESEDGLNWRKATFDPPRKENYRQVVYPGRPAAMGNCVYYDPYDDNPDRRYKMTDVAGCESVENKDPFCTLLYSSDGRDFKFDEKYPWHRRESDTGNNIIFNHHTGRYQVMMRRNLTERLIYCVESEDLRHWSQPQVVFHPVPADPPMMQRYGLRQLHYGEMFLGLLWRYQTIDETDIGKMTGRTETELVYSYDGRSWQRTYETFMPRRPLGELGWASMYGMAMLEKEDELLVYALAAQQEHGSDKDHDKTIPNAVLPGRLRKDGFVSLQSGIAGGEFTTDLLYPRSPQLTLNVKAPDGAVQVQITDHACRPLDGYSFADCAQISGDHVAVQPQWKTHHDLSAAIKAAAKEEEFPGRVRIQIRMYAAEVFSIFGDFGLGIHACGAGEDSF